VIREKTPDSNSAVRQSAPDSAAADAAADAEYDDGHDGDVDSDVLETVSVYFLSFH